MVNKPSLILIGAGGHAKSCIDVIEDEGRFSIAGLVTEISCQIEDSLFGYPRIGNDADLVDLKKHYDYAFVTVGQMQSSKVRKFLYQKLISIGFDIPVIISSKAYVSKHSNIARGSIVMHGAVINADVNIGENCIINSMALIEHDASIGDHCHISTGARINGNVTINSDTFVGSGSVLKNGIIIGGGSFIGMGALLTHDQPNDSKFLASYK